jgi:prepilin-type N-terminal cleavage/methylation domain-containing protein
MKMPRLRSFPRTAHRRSAFTLTELMIAVGLFSLVVMGSILSHLVGLRMCTINQTKLKTTHSARAALNQTEDDIRTATKVEVGNGSASGFTNITGNLPRQGNAIQIYPTLSTNTFVRYYVDTSDQTLKRVLSGGTFLAIANYITNTIPFTAEDYAGNVLTNDQNNRVIRMNFEFYQWEFASPNPGGRNVYDYFRVQTKIARRATN